MVVVLGILSSITFPRIGNLAAYADIDNAKAGIMTTGAVGGGTAVAALLTASGPIGWLAGGLAYGATLIATKVRVESAKSEIEESKRQLREAEDELLSQMEKEDALENELMTSQDHYEEKVLVAEVKEAVKLVLRMNRFLNRSKILSSTSAMNLKI